MPDSTNTDGKVKLTDAELRCCHMAQCDRDDAEGIEAWRAEFRQIARDEPGAHCMDCPLSTPTGDAKP